MGLPKLTDAGFLRRYDVQRRTEVERLIDVALDAVEKAGCHPLLTDAVVLLVRAKDKVADFLELPGDEGQGRRVFQEALRRVEAALPPDVAGAAPPRRFCGGLAGGRDWDSAAGELVVPAAGVPVVLPFDRGWTLTYTPVAKG